MSLTVFAWRFALPDLPCFALYWSVATILVLRQLCASGSALPSWKEIVFGLPFFSFGFAGLSTLVLSPSCLSATLSFGFFSFCFDSTLTSISPESVSCACLVVSTRIFGLPVLPVPASAEAATARVRAIAARQQTTTWQIRAACVKELSIPS